MTSRRPFSVVILALALLVLGAAPSAQAVEPGFANVALIDCSSGKRPEARSAVFLGEMSQIAEATQMRLRFDLSEKVGTSPWRGVGPYAVGEWRYSKPDVKRLEYRQRVVGLKPATKYRMTVTFQWLDGDGRVVAERYLRSRPCRQRGKLPNLAFRDSIHTHPGPTPGTYRYAVRIHNNGVVASPPSELRLSVDGAEVDVRRIGRLRSGERRIVRFVGPACKGRVVAQLDPRDTVREITEQDNLKTSTCDRLL